MSFSTRAKKREEKNKGKTGSYSNFADTNCTKLIQKITENHIYVNNLRLAYLAQHGISIDYSDINNDGSVKDYDNFKTSVTASISQTLPYSETNLTSQKKNTELLQIVNQLNPENQVALSNQLLVTDLQNILLNLEAQRNKLEGMFSFSYQDACKKSLNKNQNPVEINENYFNDNDNAINTSPSSNSYVNNNNDNDDVQSVESDAESPNDANDVIAQLSNQINNLQNPNTTLTAVFDLSDNEAENESSENDDEHSNNSDKDEYEEENESENSSDADDDQEDSDNGSQNNNDESDDDQDEDDDNDQDIEIELVNLQPSQPASQVVHTEVNNQQNPDVINSQQEQNAQEVVVVNQQNLAPVLVPVNQDLDYSLALVEIENALALILKEFLLIRFALWLYEKGYCVTAFVLIDLLSRHCQIVGPDLQLFVNKENLTITVKAIDDSYDQKKFEAVEKTAKDGNELLQQSILQANTTVSLNGLGNTVLGNSAKEMQSCRFFQKHGFPSAHDDNESDKRIEKERAAENEVEMAEFVK